MAFAEIVSKMVNKYQFIRNNKLATDIVLIDGIGRTGKAMLGQIISSFDRVEKLSIEIEFDYLPHLYRLGRISFDAAKTLLQVSADTYLYNLMIGRNVNHRLQDATSIYKDANPNRYIDRSTLPEGSEVGKRVKIQKPILQELTHDAIKMADFFFDIFDNNLKIIYMYRDPVPTIIEWARRDFGNRISKDPTELHLCYMWKQSAVPLLAYQWEDDYLKLKGMERIIGMINYNFHSNLAAYHKVSDQRKKLIQIVKFDDLVTDSWPVVKKTAEFLNTSTTEKTETILLRERCPRKKDPAERKQQIKYILNETKNKKYQQIFQELINKYDKNHWKI